MLRDGPAFSDDASLEIRDDSIDVIRGESAWRGIELARRQPQRLPVAGSDLVGALIESGHGGAGASPTDRLLERLSIEPCGSPIGTGRRFVALLFAVCKGAMAVGASAVSPRGQAGLHPVFVLSVDRGCLHQEADRERRSGTTPCKK